MFYRKNAENTKRTGRTGFYLQNDFIRCKHQTLVHAGHFTFNYLAARYGLQYMSAYRDSRQTRPTPKRLMEMTDYLKKNHISAIFHEELIDPKVARAIANETGASMLMLHGAHNVSKDELARGVTFLDLMEKNLNNLKVGLLCP
jgi:zinc transport system substrate-binding protein